MTRVSRVSAGNTLLIHGIFGRAQVLEEWDHAALDRSLGQMATAIQAACSDAVGEARACARAFACIRL